MLDRKQTIAVFGLGYVGCVTSACLASLGHQVRGVDKDAFKVSEVNAGRAPFFEPGLPVLVEEGVASGRLRATTSAAEALEGAAVALLCVGTPSEKNGDLDLNFLRRVAEEIAVWQRDSRQPLIVATRSTVFPGTGDEMAAIFRATAGPDTPVTIVSNPEFLREGVAVKDFREPSLLVVGGDNADAVALVAGLYADLDVKPCLVSLKTAEMIKYACNAFHAVKIAFANEVGALSERMGIDGAEVMETLCEDRKLNASAAYLRPGFAFGGSCLPKDLRAIVYRAGRLDVKLPMLENVLGSNQQHLTRAIQAVLDAPGQRIAVMGLAFKANTDDLRESPSIPLIEHLLGKGREVRVYDPHIRLEDIYGSNKNYILRAIPHVGKLLTADVAELLAWAEVVVVTNKPDATVLLQVQAAGKPVLDLGGTGLFPQAVQTLSHQTQ